MNEPTPEQYNPPLGWREHTWRTLLALTISSAVWPSVAVLQWREARAMFWLDLGIGLVTLGLSFFRRRWPLTVALLTNAAGILSFSSAGPATLAAVSLATRRVVWQVLLVGVVGFTAALVFPLLQRTSDDGPWWVTFAVGLAFTVAMLVVGMYLGSRRELLWTLRDRAERAEAEQELRVDQGRSNERARIAREMHDVLAHRISLITMHAGALAYRTDLTPEQVRETADLIQAKSHEALTDLRTVLGVLRSEDGAVPLEAPQPTFEDLSALVREAQQSGMHVQYDAQVHGSDAMPEQVGRTTYRIVQEGLTNARKHAPGTAVLVRLAGSPDAGVDICIRNPSRSTPRPSSTGNGQGRITPGAGLGLVGLRERAKLAGGRLDAHAGYGTFELRGWLPWTT